jgi:CRP-like cAMP-binding protein
MNEKYLKNISCEDCLSRECLFKESLSIEKLNRLDSIKNIIRYNKGQYIFHEGAQPSGIYCIQEGKVKIVKLGSGGKEQIIYLSKDGDVFGVKEMLSKSEYSTSSTALEDSYICHIPKVDFFYFLEDDLAFSKKVREHLCFIQDRIEEKILILTQKSVRERLAIHLLDLNKNFGLSIHNSPSFINVSLSRDDLASLVGTATETVIRLMSEFKKAGILSLKEKKITIINQPALRKIAGL